VPGRQDRRTEPPLLAGVGVDAAVIDPWRDHLDCPGRGEDLAGLVEAVAHHQPTSVAVTLTDVAGDVGLDLGLQGLGQHPTRALAHELVDHRRRAGAARVLSCVLCSRNYGEHGRTLPTGVRSADLA
jgi:hypothetical protein